jgi:hypothetical protein
MLGRPGRMTLRRTLIRLWIQSYRIVYLWCTDFVQLCICSMVSGSRSENEPSLYYSIHIIRLPGIPLTSLTLPHFCGYPKPGPGFPTSCHGPPPPFFFVFRELRWDVICSFYWYWLPCLNCLNSKLFHNMILMMLYFALYPVRSSSQKIHRWSWKFLIN